MCAMASKRRLAQTGPHSRKRARLGDLTNSSSPLCISCEDQLVPRNDEFYVENSEAGMYCSERFEFSPLKKARQVKKKFTSPSPGGFFISLPPEVLHKILAMLELQDILALCLTSHILISYVRGYVYTSAGLTHVLPSAPTSNMDNLSKANFLALGEYFPFCIT